MKAIMPLVNQTKKSFYKECFRNIKTNIKYSEDSKNKKVLLVSSMKEKEGKTNIAANLSLTLADDGIKVLLMDCDLKKPSIDYYLNIKNKKGLTEYVLDKENIDNLIYKYTNNLHVLVAGKKVENSYNVIDSKAFQRLIEEVRGRYDYIIIDSTAVKKSADTQVLTAKCDGVIIVVKCGKTKKEEFLEVETIINNIDCRSKILGVIINQ